MSTPEHKRQVYRERKQRGVCTKCGNESGGRHYCESCRKKHSSYQKPKNPEYTRQLKKEVAEHYGSKCYCCGENNLDMLTLDHIEQDGAQHRLEDPSACKLWVWAKKNSFPQILRLACYNCNVAAYRNNGVCPHQVK